MASHKSSDWLHAFQSKDDWFLMCGNSLQDVIISLSNPRSQYPSTVLLIGKNKKNAAQKALFPGCSYPTSRGLAQLNVDGSTLDNDYPLLVASIETDKAYSEVQLPRNHFGKIHHRVDWLPEQPSIISTKLLVDKVVSKLLLLFVDVVCLFLDDFPTHKEGIGLFHRWMEGVKISQPWKPRLIIVTNQGRVTEDISNLSTFGEVRHVKLASLNNKLLRSFRYHGLKNAILQDIKRVRKSRSACRMLFSATHLNVLFKSALQHVAKCNVSEFNFVHAARQLNSVDDQFRLHLQNYLALCAAIHVSKESILRYTASVIILDSLPPGMHHFEPRVIFSSLYYSHCYEAFSSRLCEYDLSPADWCTQLEAEYCYLYLELESSTLTASQLHKQTLETVQMDWKKLRSSQTCLYCLRRKPEHGLRCGHTFCDTCACIFGAKGHDMEYSYHIGQCILCQSSGELKVILKPPTAGSRLLVLDGGGIRGAFTLQALRALDEYRKLPYPIYDDFDLALGTSTGGLIALMFLLRRNLDDCVATFNELAMQVFSRHNRFGSSIIAKICGFLSSLLTDSIYGAGEMEACVKKAYGSDSLIFGSMGSKYSVSGIKIAVTTMDVSNSRLCILSNYNGTGTRRGYKHYRPLKVEDEVRVCDAARATSAAPSYFPAKFIRGLGFLQDGGAGKHNNPIAPAEWESKAIWDTVPDLAVSIGTGYAQDPGSPQVISQRLRFQDRFFPRLCRLFNAVLNAQGNWNDHLNRIHEDERYKYFRINIALEEEPPLDDVSKIPELERLATTFLKTYDFWSITQALFASSFFFELHQNPVGGKKTCSCHGSIRCRSPNTRALIHRILEEYPAASFTTEDGFDLGYIKNQGLCAMCGRYCKVVAFKVCHLNQSTSIYLKFNRLSQHRISGFPQAMSQFAKRQLLDAEFGRPDHRVGHYADLGGCKCASPGKRKRVATTTTKTKRQCFKLSDCKL